MAILTVARLTLREASRRRLLLVAVVLTVLVALLTGWGFYKVNSLSCGRGPCSVTEQKILAATLLVLLMFMFSFVLALGAAFLAAPAIYAEVESGVSLAMLARPIRRLDLVIGKWLGLVTIIAIYATGACGLEMLIGGLTLHYVPPSPVLIVIFLIAEATVILTLSLAMSTRLPAMAGGIVALVVYGITWMAGMAGEVGTAVHSQALENAGTISSLILPTDGLWRGAVYSLEPAVVIALGRSVREAGGNPFFVPAPPTTAYIIWAVLWVAAVLGIGIWSFQRRSL